MPYLDGRWYPTREHAVAEDVRTAEFGDPERLWWPRQLSWEERRQQSENVPPAGVAPVANAMVVGDWCVAAAPPL